MPLFNNFYQAEHCGWFCKIQARGRQYLTRNIPDRSNEQRTLSGWFSTDKGFDQSVPKVWTYFSERGQLPPFQDAVSEADIEKFKGCGGPWRYQLFLQRNVLAFAGLCPAGISKPVTTWGKYCSLNDKFSYKFLTYFLCLSVHVQMPCFPRRPKFRPHYPYLFSLLTAVTVNNLVLRRGSQRRPMS